MTRYGVGNKHQILGQQPEGSTSSGEPAAPVKKEDGWDLIPAGPELAEVPASPNPQCRR